MLGLKHDSRNYDEIKDYFDNIKAIYSILINFDVIVVVFPLFIILCSSIFFINSVMGTIFRGYFLC